MFLDDHGPRGLERLSSRLHAIRRQRHLQEVKHAVFIEQARQNVSNQRNSELLAQQAQYATQNSRAFANLLGIGDAWAAAHQDGDDEDDDRKLPASMPFKQQNQVQEIFTMVLSGEDRKLSPIKKKKKKKKSDGQEGEASEDSTSSETSTTKSEEELPSDASGSESSIIS
jgi:hypothetical protein